MIRKRKNTNKSVNEKRKTEESWTWAIITYKHGVYELFDELQNDLRLTT